MRRLQSAGVRLPDNAVRGAVITAVGSVDPVPAVVPDRAADGSDENEKEVLVMKVVVREWESVLVYRDGRLEKALPTGRHRVRLRRRELARFDLRPSATVVPGQELLTADGLSVRLSLVVRSRVAAPRTAHEAVQDPWAELYTAVQVALRTEVASRSLEELLAGRDGLGDAVREAASPAAEAIGRVLERVDVRDVMVPAELRQATLRVVTARQEGLAALERARGETAALRSLANAARLAQDTPALLALRTLRAVETGNATVVLRQDAQPQ
jgi:regulator of protease activity HflC (stomatin/prohibitin superfamily)